MTSPAFLLLQSLEFISSSCPMSEALITQLEALTENAASETPLLVVLQAVDALLARLRDLTEDEARACERAALKACDELATQAGRLASLPNPCAGTEGAAGLQTTVTALADRCWRAVAACDLTWAVFIHLGRLDALAGGPFYRLLSSCSSTFAPACSLLQQLCCAAAPLDPPAQQQVGVSLAAAAEQVLSSLWGALHITGAALKDIDAEVLPAALKPPALISLLEDIINIMQFVGAAAGPAKHSWSPDVWDCMHFLLDLSNKEPGGRPSLGQHVLQLRALAAATHSSLFADFSRKGFSDGWGKCWWRVANVLLCASYAAQARPVPQDDDSIREQCGVLLGLLPLLGSTQGALPHAVHCAAGLSFACTIALGSAMQAGAQPASEAQLLLCLDAGTLCTAALLAAVELGHCEEDASRCPASLGILLDRLKTFNGMLVFWTRVWDGTGVDSIGSIRGRSSHTSSGSGICSSSDSRAEQLAVAAAEAAECTMRLVGLLLRQWGSIEGSLKTATLLVGSAVQLLQSAGRVGGSGAAFVRASSSAAVSAAKLALTMLELPQARQAQWTKDPHTQPNSAAGLLLFAAADCCTAAAPADEGLQDSLRRHHDAAVVSLIYAGRQVALSSSNCKEDAACATWLLQLGSQLAGGAWSALLFHQLGGPEMLTTACQRLLDYNLTDFASEQPDLTLVAHTINDMDRVGLQAGVALAACGFLERLVCWVEKGLVRMRGKSSKKLRKVLVDLRMVAMACCLNVSHEGHKASGEPATASCQDCASCRWRRQHAAWFEEVSDKQLCSAKLWARFRQEALPQLAGSIEAAISARQKAEEAVRDVVQQRAAAALQARACSNLGCTNLRGCCEGWLPAQKQGGAGRFCSPECQAMAEGQLARLCSLGA